MDEDCLASWDLRSLKETDLRCDEGDRPIALIGSGAFPLSTTLSCYSSDISQAGASVDAQLTLNPAPAYYEAIAVTHGYARIHASKTYFAVEVS